MKRLYFKYPLTMIACALLSLLSYSCSDELEYNNANARVEEGLPATVKIAVKVNDMSTKSRSIVDEEGANLCDNLWIGLYSKDTGKRISYTYTKDVANNTEEIGTQYSVELSTSSANDVYIVAVANSDVNSGIGNVGKYGVTESSTLRDMLDDADTWEKFQNICVLRPDASDVNVYANTLTMSGHFCHSSDGELETLNIAPGPNDLTADGAIYLKRIISYNKFIIEPGDNVNLSLNTWQVCNIPAGCYIFEQDGNVDDEYTGKASFHNNSLASHQFTTTGDDTGGKYFEFYQLENKHTALDYAADGTDHVGISSAEGVDMYTEREREFKNADGTNSGVYRSLVNSSKTNMANNNASYVVVNASLDYYILADAAADEAVPVDPTLYPGQTIHRTATVNYTIHLGYCEDKNADGTASLKTAQDFNCRRNTKYTYHVKINGVKNVVVEATKDPENQPGVEGWVSDETGAYQKLDSHYCEFNICLTDEERNGLYYRITSPYDGKYYYYSRDIEGNITKTEGMNEELYSWIKFAPTTDENTLAKYNGGVGLWTFDDMCAPDAKTNPAKADDNGGKWYTVFIDEYVYHFDDDKSGEETSWFRYVNQDDRIAEFLLHVDKSTDQESSYSYCKYAFGQKSIQTFYKSITAGQRAIGVEHEEETYCLNMAWVYMYTSDNVGLYERIETRDSANQPRGYTVYDFTNGRYNITYYLDQKVKRGDGDIYWEDVIQESKPCHVNAGSSSVTSSYKISHPAADYPVYMPNGIVSSGLSNKPTDGDNSYIANSICMNRNRDLNGDGKISQDEIRWFMPTSSMYIQIAVAQSELPDPIMRFTDYNPDYFLKYWASTDYRADREGTYNYHYITSDYQYFWAEQSVTTGDGPLNGYETAINQAYTVRCVRNLGTDPSKVPVKDVPEVDNAFSYNEKTRIFTQSNFTDVTLRGYTLGGIAPHDVASPAARPYRKFEVAKDMAKNLSDDYVSVNSSGTISFTGTSDMYGKVVAWTNSLKVNGICGQYTQEADKSDLGTWRVPNSCELSLMWIGGLIPYTTCYLCGTHSYFITYGLKSYDDNNKTYLGYIEDNSLFRHVLGMDALSTYSGSQHVKCVRDVKD